MNLPRILVPLALACLVASADVCAQSPNSVGGASVATVQGVFGPVSLRLKAGDFAPDITFTKVLQPVGGVWSSAELSGKATVLVFFPLVSRNPQPMRMWNALVEQFAGKPVEFVMITSEKEATLLPWLAEHPLGGAVLYDADGQTGRAYGLEMPDVVYIGADRRIVGFNQAIVPDARTLNAVLDGHIATEQPKPDMASVKAFLASGLVPLEGQATRMPRPEDNRPAFPPSETLHVSPAKDEIGSGNSSADDFWSLRGYTLKRLIEEMYDVSPIRIVLPASLDSGKRYDFAIVLPAPKSRDEMRRVVQQGIQDYFHVTATREEQLMDAYVVTAPSGTPPVTAARQRAGRMGGISSSGVEYESTASMDETLSNSAKPLTINALHGISIRNATLDDFCRTLEGELDRPVVNETNLEGKYDFQVRAGQGQPNDFLERLRSQLNLVVTPARRNVQTLVLTMR